MALSCSCHRSSSSFAAASLEAPSRAERLRVSPQGCGGSQWSPPLPRVTFLPGGDHPSSILPSFPASSLSLQHGMAVSPSPPLVSQLPVTCAQLSLGHYFLIPGSPLCRGRCSCLHQLGSWPGASLTHLHGHMKDWGKAVCQQEKNCVGFSSERNSEKSMKSVQKFKERLNLKQQIRDISPLFPRTSPISPI